MNKPKEWTPPRTLLSEYTNAEIAAEHQLRGLRMKAGDGLYYRTEGMGCCNDPACPKCKGRGWYATGDVTS